MSGVQCVGGGMHHVLRKWQVSVWRASMPRMKSEGACHTAQHTAWRRSGRASKALTRPMPLAVPPGCSVSPLSETRRGAAAHIEVQLVLVARRGVRSTHHVGCRELQCNSQSVFGEGSVAMCRWYCSFTRTCCEFTAVAPQLCCCIARPQMLLNHSPLPPIGRQWALHRLPDETPSSPSPLGAIGFLLGCLLFLK